MQTEYEWRKDQSKSHAALLSEALRELRVELGPDAAIEDYQVQWRCRSLWIKSWKNRNDGLDDAGPVR